MIPAAAIASEVPGYLRTNASKARRTETFLSSLGSGAIPASTRLPIRANSSDATDEGACDWATSSDDLSAAFGVDSGRAAKPSSVFFWRRTSATAVLARRSTTRSGVTFTSPSALTTSSRYSPERSSTRD